MHMTAIRVRLHFCNKRLHFCFPKALFKLNTRSDGNWRCCQQVTCNKITMQCNRHGDNRMYVDCVHTIHAPSGSVQCKISCIIYIMRYIRTNLTYISACIRTHPHTRTHTHQNTHTQTDTHTHTLAFRSLCGDPISTDSVIP